ncbi:MAG: transposase [Methylobacter sp.]
MPKSRYRVQCNPCPHFLTATVNHWLPLFTCLETVNIVLDSWRFLQQDSGFQLYGYVILENHLYLIPKRHKFRLSRQAAQLSFIAASEDLSHDMQRFTSYTAKQIIAHPEQCRSAKLLELLAFFKRAHKQDTTYQVWEEGSHPQVIEF